MSDTATQPQTPAEELLDRATEHAAARTVPFLIGLDHMRRMFALKDQKDRDDHVIQKRALGAEDVATEPEDMGDIMVSGDSTKTENHYHYSNPPASQPAEAGKVAPASTARKLLPLALAAGLGAGGLWLADNLDKFAWPGVPDTAYEVRFYNSDGELIEVPRHE